jgi:hypothetical protein
MSRIESAFMSVPQITIRLLPKAKRDFERYADALGLKASELAKLLIVRERALKRLARLKRAGNVPKRKRQRRGSAIPMLSVTAHLSSVKEVEQFDAYVTGCDLNRDSAGAWLLEDELRDKWLERALHSR